MTIKMGDRIKFRAATRWSCAAVWRKVNGFRKDPVFNWRDGVTSNWPTVRYGGHSDFVVRSDEIIEVNPA